VASRSLVAAGLDVRLPRRWEGRIYCRETPTAEFDPERDAAPGHAQRPLLSGTPARGANGWRGERPHPVLHLGTFALPPSRGDYGSEAVEVMRADDVFVALLEFGADEAGSALFAARGMPRPRADEFSPAALQRRLRGQSGLQRFFTEGKRAFCLYVVLGSHSRRAQLVPEVHELLDGIGLGAA
jgi:hypothetical protein